MKSLKRFLSLMLAFCMLFAFAGCKDNPDEYDYYSVYEEEIVDVESGNESKDNQSQDNQSQNNQSQNNQSQNNQSQNNQSQNNQSQNNQSQNNQSQNNQSQNNQSQNNQSQNNNSSSNNSSGGTTIIVDNNNNSSNNNSSNKNDGNKNSLNVPSELSGTTIKVLSYNPISEISGGQKAIDNFTKETGIKVKWIRASYDSYDTEIAAYVAGGNSPDVVYLNHFVISRMKNMQPISCTGYDFSDKSVWDVKTMSAYSINGKAYAMHLNPTLTVFQQPQAMYYNKDTISEYSFDDPYELWQAGKWDLNTFIKMCREFKEASGEKAWSPHECWDYLNYLNLNGILNFDGKTVSAATSNSKVVTALQQQATWRQEGLQGDYLDVSSIQEGTGLFVSWNFGTARSSNSYFKDLKSNGSLGIVPPPSINGQSAYYTYMDEYEGYAIPKGAKNAKAVPYFLRYYLDKNNYDMNTFFASKDAIEVYDFLMSQNRVMSTRFLNGMKGDSEKYTLKLRNSAPAQIQTTVSSYAPTFKAIADDLNETIKKNFK